MINETLKKIYDDNSENQTKTFEQFVEETVKHFSYEVRREAFENKIVNTIKEWYPELLVEVRYMGDGGRVITIFNTPIHLYQDIKSRCWDLLDSFKEKSEFDLTVTTKTRDITEKFYPEKLK